jgi:hypothetical protein
VQDWAMEITVENGIDRFKASNGWLNSFLERNGYSFRRITNLTALSSEELIKRATNYMQFLQNARDDNLALQQTILMDETAVYLEDPRRITINESGKRHVSLRSTGFASMRITTLLAVSGNEKKLRPMIICKKARASTPSFELKGGCYICYNEKAWVNGELIKKWIDLLFPLVSMATGKTLIWDSCRAHIAKNVKQHMKRRGIQNIVIPGGLTPYVQAGDLGIYKSLTKSALLLLLGKSRIKWNVHVEIIQNLQRWTQLSIGLQLPGIK